MPTCELLKREWTIVMRQTPAEKASDRIEVENRFWAYSDGFRFCPARRRMAHRSLSFVSDVLFITRDTPYNSPPSLNPSTAPKSPTAMLPKMFASANRRCPSWRSRNDSYENVEKVVYAPRKPVAKNRRNSGWVEGYWPRKDISNPRRKHPLTLTRNVP